ncbi:alanine racemase [Mobiluncus mulieris]|uniref:Alanine racemase n=1 Tax=Mobiluncus mulieris TaxID=2052 RepID=A0A8G2HSJ3_9ACTO|nr:alanine racemase [Mobiluncus mulieris]MBB5845444.1 alanine racemase [Mobiluncus mulieris]STO15883.1 Alanine racemase [Mobiluncus mulieris]
MTHTDNQVSWPVRAVVDLAAYRANLARMRKFAPRSQQMAIVKADAYGHGMEQVSLAAIEAGAQWLGVAKVAEAYRLRQFLDKSGVARDHFGDTPTSALLRSRMFQSDAAGLPTAQRPRIFAWLYTPSTDLKSTIKAEIDLSVSTLDQLDQVSHAADAAGLRARIHLKVDTGLCRGGATLSEFENLCKLARARERSGLVEVSAIWSHFARSDEPSAEAEAFTQGQLATFNQAYDIALVSGLQPKLRHMAATGAILWYPESHFNLVRVGISAYGLSPNPQIASAQNLGIRPVMRLETEVAQVKKVAAGSAVSYGGEWVAAEPTWLALLPIGYADGFMRRLQGKAKVWVAGHLWPVVGRIPMDQIILNLGSAIDGAGDLIPPPLKPGDLAVIFGDPNRLPPGFPPGEPAGESTVADLWNHDPVPSADALAAAADTISYEILTAVDKDTPRIYVDKTKKEK